MLHRLDYFAPGARSEAIPTDDLCPDLCIVDMVTIIHLVPLGARRDEHATRSKSRNRRTIALISPSLSSSRIVRRVVPKLPSTQGLSLASTRGGRYLPLKPLRMRYVSAGGLRFPMEKMVTPSKERMARVKGFN